MQILPAATTRQLFRQSQSPRMSFQPELTTASCRIEGQPEIIFPVVNLKFPSHSPLGITCISSLRLSHCTQAQCPTEAPGRKRE